MSKRKSKGPKASGKLVDENGKKITFAEAVKRGILDPTLDPTQPTQRGRSLGKRAEARRDPTGLEAADVRTSGRPTAKRAKSVVSGGLPGHGKRR